MARQALRFTLEATPGSFDSGADVSDITLLRMTTPVIDQPRPITWTIRDAAGSNRRVQTGSEQNTMVLKVSTHLFYGQAALLLPAFCTPTGGLPGLQTFTIDQFTALDVSAFTKQYTRWLGCTPQTLSLKASNSGQGVLIGAEMDFLCRNFSHSITSTDFADPALTDYDYSPPATLEDMAGHVSVNGITANFKSFDLSVKNTLDECYDERANPQPQFYGARDVDWSMDFRMVSNAFRAAYEAVTPYGVSLAMTDGTTTITFNLHSKNYSGTLEKSQPFDKAFYESVKGMTHLDPAAGTDLTLTVS